MADKIIIIKNAPGADVEIGPKDEPTLASVVIQGPPGAPGLPGVDGLQSGIISPGTYGPSVSTISVDTYGRVTAITIGSGLPDQTGQSGKFLTTDGHNASWAASGIDTTANYDWTGIHTFERAIAVNGGIVDASATDGVLSIGHGLQGTSGDTNTWLQYLPTDVTTDPFLFSTFKSTGGGLLTRPDHIMNWGWNLAPGGGLINSGVRRGAIGWQLEDYWEQFPGDTSTAQMEAHMLYVGPDGIQRRPISLLASLVAPYNRTLFIDATTVSIGSGADSNGPQQVVVGVDDTRLFSPSGLVHLFLEDNTAAGPDNNFVQLSAGSPNLGANRSMLQLFANGAATLDTRAPSTIKDQTGAKPQLYWDSNNTYLQSPDGHALVQASNGTGPIFYSNGAAVMFIQDAQVFVNNKLLYLQHDNVGTNTRGDQVAALLVRNTTAATALAPRQFSPGITQTGYAWTGAASQPTSFKWQVENTSGATPGAKLVLGYSTDETNFTDLILFDKDGGIDSVGNQLLLGNLNATLGNIGPSSQFYWNATRTAMVGVDGFSNTILIQDGAANPIHLISAIPTLVDVGVVTPAIGSSNAQQHAVPAVTSSTLAVLGAAQTWTGQQTYTNDILFTTSPPGTGIDTASVGQLNLGATHANQVACFPQFWIEQASNQLRLGIPDHHVLISSTAPVAGVQTLTIPDTGGSDVFAFLGQAQTWTQLQKFTLGIQADSIDSIGASLAIGGVNATSGVIGPNNGSTTFGQIFWGASGPTLLGPSPGFNELDVYGNSLTTQLGGQFASAGPFNVTGGILTPFIGLYNGGTFIKHTVPAVTSDTLALVAAVQTLTNKTLNGAKFIETVVADAAVDQYAALKVSTSTAGRYIMMAAGDSAGLFIGVANTLAAGAASTFDAIFVQGTVTTMLSDGTATIPIGSGVVPSATVAGRVMAGAGGSVIGFNVGALVAATLNAQVSVR